MMRSKSPFKKKSPKEPKEEIVTDGSRPPVRHWTSVQEFQEFRKEQHLINGNAFAQKRASRERSGTIGEQCFPESPMTSMGQFIEAGRREPTTMVSKTPQSTPMKTPKKKKNAPPPLNLVPAGDMLKLVPDGAEYAIPTQREKNESTRHKKMEDMMYDAIAEGNESAAPSFVSVDSEKIEKRPKSPGKKFFDFFKGGASSPKAPETPEIPATYKASKILGDESLGRKKGKAIAAAQKKRKKDGFDFKCSGPTPNIGGDSFDAPTDQEIRMTADHAVYSPTDFEIRKVGGRGTIVPMLSTQRTVSDSSTVVGARVGTIKSSEAVAKHSSEIFLRTKSLQYMNDSLPPTPPSKESIKTRDRQDSIKNRALVTDYPPRSISTVPEDEDSSETPNTAILASPTPLPKTTPLPKGLTQFTHNDYADLVLNNKSSIVSLQGSISETESVCSSMHNLTRNTSTEMLIDSYLDSDDNVVMKSSSNNSVVTAYEGRLGSLTPSVSSLRSNISRLSSRWSDGSMLSQIAQVKMLQVPEMLRPGFYSPASFHLAGFKPSRNRDTSVFVLPKSSPKGLGYHLLESSEDEISPSSTISSSFASNSDTCRSASIAIGLGVTLSPLLASALNMTSDMSPASDVQTSFPNGHPSAMPAPLRFSQQSRATAAAENEDPKSPLPANQTLDAYLVLHNHIDRSQWATQEAVVRETKDVNKEVVKAHHENLKHLSTLFGDVMEKVKSIENESVRTAEGVERYKLEVIDAVNAMGAAMQNNLVKPMDKLFESNTTLAMKVDKLSTRIEELEKQSKANTDVLASFQPPQESMLNMSSSSRPGTMYSTASHDAVNSYDTVTGAVSPPYAGVPSGGPPGLPNPSSTYYNPYGAAHPSQWSGGYMLPQSTIKDLGREQRHMYFSSFGDTHMQATSGNMPTHPAFRNGNGHGQSQ